MTAGWRPENAAVKPPCQDIVPVAWCAPFTPRRCCSSVVEHSLGKGEAESSILSSSTILSLDNPFAYIQFPIEMRLAAR